MATATITTTTVVFSVLYTAAAAVTARLLDHHLDFLRDTLMATTTVALGGP